MTVQTIYQDTLKFASIKHLGQTLPSSSIPYVVHLSNVAMEILVAAQHHSDFNLTLALQLALLHDTMEDTDTSYYELEQEFGTTVAAGVLALTKNSALPKKERMMDSLKRIRESVPEVWAVKLADRITNLQQPPAHWDATKKADYQEQAKVILAQLSGGNTFLEHRLAEKIKAYSQYL